MEAHFDNFEFEEDSYQGEEDRSRDGDEQGNQELERLREQDLADKGQISAGIGQKDSSQVITDRLARSRRDGS